MTDRFDVLDRYERLVRAPEPSFEGFLRRRDRKHRNQRLAAGVVAIAILAAPIAWIVATGGGSDRTKTPSSDGPGVVQPGTDYVLDLDTGATTPLPGSIDGARYAASPGGSMLAYVGDGVDGSPQIFIANIDGAGVRQATRDPVGAGWPAWSPDGTSVAYVAYGSGDVQNLFILEIATGEARQITHGTRGLWGPTFTPDGSSLLYTDPGRASEGEEMRIVPVGGGKSTILFGGGHGGMGRAGGGSMSPDGSLVTMTGDEVGGPGAAIFVSNTDGTQRRAIPGYGTDPAGTWSPDGSRIVCLSYRGRIIVVDVATGESSPVADSSGAIWLDDHTLLIE